MIICQKVTFVLQRINRLIKWSLVINFISLALREVNVEFGYGRMKEMHRKTILKHLKADLYSYSYSCIKKSRIKIWQNGGTQLSKKEKAQYEKKKQKFYIKFAAKTDSGAGKIKSFC